MSVNLDYLLDIIREDGGVPNFILELKHGILVYLILLVVQDGMNADSEFLIFFKNVIVNDGNVEGFPHIPGEEANDGVEGLEIFVLCSWSVED